jgi:excisionase family DNA binding protein
MENNNERLTYTVREAAHVLGLSRNSVYQGIATGEIPSVRIGRRLVIPRRKIRLLLGDNEAKSETTI